ncbi:hypothetical protein D0T11_20965 [Hymenobacter rubripertinctus]|uniref:Uncharacterized protein n=1 Tax=Hymenobacter rubripertinctus TaxID=2029981 RepID=A0A418QIT7_9BACT|nr:hypothetical protein D0T11_20965 [Hymenobacter rubripertinctus]
MSPARRPQRPFVVAAVGTEQAGQEGNAFLALRYQAQTGAERPAPGSGHILISWPDFPIPDSPQSKPSSAKLW